MCFHSHLSADLPCRFGSLQRLETPKAPPAWMTLSAAESSGGKSERKCAWRQRGEWAPAPKKCLSLLSASENSCLEFHRVPVLSIRAKNQLWIMSWDVCCLISLIISGSWLFCHMDECKQQRWWDMAMWNHRERKAHLQVQCECSAERAVLARYLYIRY